MIDFIKEIKPEIKGKSDKFSWNLYNWLKKNPNLYRIYKATWNPVSGIGEPDSYYVGNMEDGWFSGLMLMRVCCGSKHAYAFGKAHDIDNWIDITNEFYEKYREMGVCAIPNYYTCHNWEYKGKTTRQCKNCGIIEKRRTVRIPTQIWERTN
jgi:hypothetical protein